MKFGVYNAILHDRSLLDAIEVIANLGLTGIELNSGGFLPPVHITTFDDILSSDAARDDFLGLFEGTGVEIAGLNCNGNPLHPDPSSGRSMQRIYAAASGSRIVWDSTGWSRCQACPQESWVADGRTGS
jgi:sugar phosphate isomerase/epimerase